MKSGPQKDRTYVALEVMFSFEPYLENASQGDQFHVIVSARVIEADVEQGHVGLQSSLKVVFGRKSEFSGEEVDFAFVKIYSSVFLGNVGHGYVA